MRILLPLLAATALCAAATAQCATLTIAGSGAPGTDLTVDLSATPRSFAALVVGDTAGTTLAHTNCCMSSNASLQPYVAYLLCVACEMQTRQERNRQAHGAPASICRGV